MLWVNIVSLDTWCRVIAHVKPVISTVTKFFSCHVNFILFFCFSYTFIYVYKSNLQRLFKSLCFVCFVLFLLLSSDHNAW